VLVKDIHYCLGTKGGLYKVSIIAGLIGFEVGKFIVSNAGVSGDPVKMKVVMSL
jgi:hypothetical protein